MVVKKNGDVPWDRIRYKNSATKTNKNRPKSSKETRPLLRQLRKALFGQSRGQTTTEPEGFQLNMAGWVESSSFLINTIKNKGGSLHGSVGLLTQGCRNQQIKKNKGGVGIPN